MRRIVLVSLILALGIAVRAQDEMMEPMPTKELEKINFLLGHGKGDMTLYWMGQESKAKTETVCEMGLGGRFVVMKNTMDMPGMGKVEGLFMITYNAKEKAFLGWWYDQMASDALKFKGNMEGNKLVMTSDLFEMPGMPAQTKMRSTYEPQGKNVLFTLDMEANGKWQPMMKCSYENTPKGK